MSSIQAKVSLSLNCQQPCGNFDWPIGRLFGQFSAAVSQFSKLVLIVHIQWMVVGEMAGSKLESQSQFVLSVSCQVAI